MNTKFSFKICVGYHKPSLLLQGSCFLPIWGGKIATQQITKEGDVLSPEEIEWMNLHCIGDDTGLNISEKNRHYSEASIIYWMWKNYNQLGSPDYIGFLQYRRHWLINERYLQTHKPNFYNMVWNEYFSKDYQYKIGLTENNIQSILQETDGIFCANKTAQTVHSYKENHHSQNIKYWNEALKIIQQDWPQYADAALKYDQGYWHVWSNCFIMKKEDFLEYCPFLFDVLSKIDNFAKVEYSEMTAEQMRVPAYVSETMLGIFWTYLQNKQRILKSFPLMYIAKPFKSLCVLPQHIRPTKPQAKAIVFIADNSYLKYTSVAILSLILNLSKESIYDIIILEDGNISEATKQRLCQLSSQNISIRFFNAQYYIQKYNLTDFFHRRLNIMPYLKLFLHEILDQYNKALFLDGDLISLQDVTELWDIPLGNNLIAASQDPILVSVKTDFWEKRRKYIVDNKKMKDIQHYINSGVVLFNLQEMRNTPEITNLFLNEARFKHKDRLHHDQDVLNFVLEGKIKYFSSKYNFHSCLNIPVHLNNIPAQLKTLFLRQLNSQDFSILHYDGDLKPWQTLTANNYLSDLWWKYAKRSPFYEELLLGCIQRSCNRSPLLLRNALNYSKFLRNYYRCKVLSKITWGKTRRHYQQKRDSLHQQVRQIREFLKK